MQRSFLRDKYFNCQNCSKNLEIDFRYSFYKTNIQLTFPVIFGSHQQK